jgi:hypothetical protein
VAQALQFLWLLGQEVAQRQQVVLLLFLTLVFLQQVVAGQVLIFTMVALVLVVREILEDLVLQQTTRVEFRLRGQVAVVVVMLGLGPTEMERLTQAVQAAVHHQRHMVVVHLVVVAAATAEPPAEVVVTEQVVEETMVLVAMEKEAVQVQQVVLTSNILQIRN